MEDRRYVGLWSDFDLINHMTLITRFIGPLLSVLDHHLLPIPIPRPPAPTLSFSPGDDDDVWCQEGDIMGADSLSEFDFPTQVFNRLPFLPMLCYGFSCQADDGADFWSNPSKHCGIFWETSIVPLDSIHAHRGYALPVLATIHAIAAKVTLATHKLLAAAAISAIPHTPPPMMMNKLTPRQPIQQGCQPSSSRSSRFGSYRHTSRRVPRKTITSHVE
ncbi:uncharacterized protein LACBIDRAFT_329326 [Laccaria bicolor S238N-H82]|uniref:Predicted protein n=1 Tax=Laccaria bicolor (strain S238N-H82 / ATCC MYA-4686) TaxID=486041 RepID=B0DHP2_LACBS|nr:uncharacterized protein LACBIDRAFT_329326 [Laccaria bicolor S238N-H82]EDR05870.1 predicted protein [Laccaria bicolor S238N-H82]|eukprot:XP_001883546.1 predicted protein [Laccaria bicolor S238N-H82]